MQKVRCILKKKRTFANRKNRKDARVVEEARLESV